MKKFGFCGLRFVTSFEVKPFPFPSTTSILESVIFGMFKPDSFIPSSSKQGVVYDVVTEVEAVVDVISGVVYDVDVVSVADVEEK